MARLGRVAAVLMSIAVMASALMSSSNVASAAMTGTAASGTAMIVSDATVDVLPVTPVAAATVAQKAVPTFVHPVWPTITGATPVWVDAGPVTTANGPFSFRKTITLPASASRVTGSASVTADNAFELYVNATKVGGAGIMSEWPSACDTDGSEWKTVKTFQFGALLKPGDNLFEIRAINYAGTLAGAPTCPAPWNWGANPAMVIFRADVTFQTTLEATVRVLGPVSLAGGDDVRVAILTTPNFDATKVDAKTVCFGSATNAAARDCSPLGSRLAKVASATPVDLVVAYRSGHNGLVVGDTTACVTGKLLDGTSFEGCAPVTMRTAESGGKTEQTHNEGRNEHGTAGNKVEPDATHSNTHTADRDGQHRELDR